MHTGEKAFVCQYCNRRFGVASNLNRHIKRCPQRPKDASALAGLSSTSISTLISSTYPASTTCTLNLGLREQVPYSETSPFDLATSSNPIVSTLNLHGAPLPPSSSSSSFYVYPGPQTGSMARSNRNPNPRSSELIQVPGRRTRGGSGRSNQRPPSDRHSASAPDLSSLPNETTLPSRRPRSNSRSPAHDSSEYAHGSSGNISNADSGASLSSETTRQLDDKPRKRPRRPPSPSTWVPESLANFDLYPAPALTRAVPCPLPPVKPVYDPVTNTFIEERDSFASTLAATMPPGTSDDELSSSSEGLEDDDDAHNDENAEPSTRGAFDASSRARERGLARANRAAAREARTRARMALYYSYHPAGYSGRLPGPAVVLGTGPEGDAVIERVPGVSGSRSTAGLGANMVGVDMTNLHFEMMTGDPSEGASGSSTRGS